MTTSIVQPNFNGGEIAPKLWGHVDLNLYHRGAATARNVFCNYLGGLDSRAGTAFIGRCKQTPPAAPPRDIPFSFAITQSLVLEFGDNYMRIKANGAYVLESPFAIASVTHANPCTIFAAAENFAIADWVVISGVPGLQPDAYLVGANNPGVDFTPTTLDGVTINSSGFPAYTGGGTVARIFTLATPYAAVDLPYLKFAQSADVMSLTCVNTVTGVEYPPYELSRFGPTAWTLVPLSLGATIVAPVGLTATASNHPDPATSPPTQPAAYAYVVTAVNLQTGAESIASTRVDVTDTVDMGVTAGSITISWDAVVGAGKYNIYRTAPAYNTKTGDTANALPVPGGAQFFFAGQSYGNSFVDSNITTDANKTPPLHSDPMAPGQITGITVTASSADWNTATVAIATSTGSGFVGEVVIFNSTIVAVIAHNSGQGYAATDIVQFSGDGTSAAATIILGPTAGTYAAVVAYFQQRRFYAQSLNLPDTFWASQTGLFTNFDTGDPPTPNDSITASPFSQAVNGIQWLIAMPGGLVILSGTSAWQLSGTGGSALNPQPITPGSEQALSQAFNGCSAFLPPIRLGYDIMFADSVGSLVYSLNYNIYFNIYNASEISWQSNHLFLGYEVTQWAWCRSPNRLIWAARNDGTMLSLAWVKEQEVMGWTRHDTQGLVQGVCTISEPPVDALYLIVQRLVQGRFLYFAERMNNRIWPSAEDSWCVDCGLSTLGPASTPPATLQASSATGSGVTFLANADLFSPGNVGGVLRLGGGIVTVTAYVSPTTLIGTWTRPCVATIPSDPGNTPLPAPPGSWSILGLFTSVSGLGHLEGKLVVGLADGIPIGPLTVTNGSVPLPFAASLVTVGLAFTPQVQSLYLAASQPTEQGKRKNINAVTVRVAASGMPAAGTNEADGSALDPQQLGPIWSGLQQLKPTPQGAAPATYLSTSGQSVTPLFTGDLRANVSSTWRKQGQVAVQQNAPLPLSITAFVPEYLPGDIDDMAFSQRQQPPSQQPRRAA